MNEFWTLFVATLPTGLGTGVVLALAHYLAWHQRLRFSTFPPINYAIGMVVLFGGYTTWAATLPPGWLPLPVVAGCFLITGWAGLADVLVWLWHPHQTAVETATTVAGLETALEETRRGG